MLNIGIALSLCEIIAFCGTRCVIVDIQAPSFTRVNSLRLQSQCLAITAFCKASQKDKFYLFFLRPLHGLKEDISKPKDKRKVPSCAGLLVGLI